MKEEFIETIMQQMLPYLDNAQIEKLKPGFPKYVTCHLTTVDLICFQEQPAAV